MCFLLSDEQTFFLSLWTFIAEERTTTRQQESLSRTKVERFWDLNTHISRNRKSSLFSSHQSDSRLRYSRIKRTARKAPSRPLPRRWLLRCRLRRNDCAFMFVYVEMTHLSSSSIFSLSRLSFFLGKPYRRLSIRTRTKTPISSWLHSIMTTTPKGATRYKAAQFEWESR